MIGEETSMTQWVLCLLDTYEFPIRWQDHRRTRKLGE